MSDLCVFTTGSDTRLLRKSCERVGIDLQEYHCPWKTYVSVKLIEGRKFLATVDKPYAMWVDGNDSLIVQPEEEILKRWQTEYFGSIILSSEANCWPDKHLEAEYPPVGGYLNAGGFIGCTKSLLAAMGEVEQVAEWDDQRAWTRWYLYNPVCLRIDVRRRIFSSISDGDAALQADSCVKHWNGKIPGREEYWNKICSA